MMRVTEALLLVALLAGCKQRGNNDPSQVASISGVAEYFPDVSLRREYLRRSRAVWDAMIPYGCRSCHGGTATGAFGHARLPNYDFFASSALAYMELSTDANLKGIARFQMAKFASIMPPPRAGRAPDAQALEAVAPGSLAKGGDPKVAAALGGTAAYVNDQGVCLDEVNTGKDPYGDSFCEAIDELYHFATTYPGDWNHDIVAVARSNVGELRNFSGFERDRVRLENILKRTVDRVVTTELDHAMVDDPKVVYKEKDHTIAYFVKPAPDDSYVAFTVQKLQDREYWPRLRSIFPAERGANLPRGTFHVNDILYDPIFSPDFKAGLDGETPAGFMLGGGDAVGGSANKFYSFFSPLRLGSPRLHALATPDEYVVDADFTVELKGIYGYGTIAHITDRSAVAPAWAAKRTSEKHYYIILGKTGAWISMSPRRAGSELLLKEDVDTVVNIAPVCEQINRRHGVMVSPDGRWLSALDPNTHVAYIYHTKTCAEFVVTLAGQPIKPDKLSFSADGRFATFHAYGPDGQGDDQVPFMAHDAIKHLADAGKESHVYVTKLPDPAGVSAGGSLDNTRRVSDGDGISVFPTFNGAGTRIYFSRHRRGENASEVVYTDFDHTQF